ncbi:MAG: porin [Alphaproteobacteria bacterium]|nr:porin [Alphaproteobacteria bacterium]
MAKARHSRLVLLVLTGLCVLAGPAYAQTGLAAEPYLLGDWGGLRPRLVEQGVRFDFQYVSDTLWGFNSQQTPFAMWNRFRATVDIDFGALAGFDGWYFHATGLTQGGGNLGLDLGLVTGPSGLVSANTTRLDSWWIEKRWLDDRIAVRVGQFAGFHNTMSLGYVRNSLSPDFLPPGMTAWQTEHGFEFNVLLRYGPLAIQPVFQYYTNVGGIGGDAFVVGFRTKVDF